MKSKIILLLLIFTTIFSQSYAQIRLDPFYPYSRWTVGIGMGYSTMYGDLANSTSEPVYRIDLARNFNEWVSVGLQVQSGAVSDYTGKTTWTTGLNAYNQFTSYDLSGRIALGELFNWPRSFLAKTLYGIYIGAGVGYMHNNVSSITMKFKGTDQYTITEYNADNIKTNTNNFFIPMNLGIDLHLTRVVMLNINYQLDYAFSDYVDGYDFQKPLANNTTNDMFSVLSLGLKFYVGQINMTPNRK